MVSLLALTTRVPISFEARHCPGWSCVTKLPCADEPAGALLDIAEPDPEAVVPDNIVPAPDAPDELPPDDIVAEPAAPPAEVDPEVPALAVPPGAPGPGLPPEVDEMPPDPEEPGMELAPPPGSMAGEPEVAAPEPDAAGRSADGVDKGPVGWGAVVDWAKTGAARAVAKRQAAMCFFSMGRSPAGARIMRPQRTAPTPPGLHRSSPRAAFRAHEPTGSACSCMGAPRSCTR
jgi:hypothetical protein